LIRQEDAEDDLQDPKRIRNANNMEELASVVKERFDRTAEETSE
jgi:hypothetical protein